MNEFVCTDEITVETARKLHQNHMQLLGIANTMSLAEAYNRRRYGRQQQWREELFQKQLEQLIDDNGPLTVPPIEFDWDIGREA